MMDDAANGITVSVVIPFYSNAGWLREAVDSVLAQTFTGYEIIVVNDGSEEDVSAFLEKYEAKIRYFAKENGGASSARNLGIREARGEFLAFLDSDDLWKPEKLAAQIAKIREHGAQWSYTGYETFGEGQETKVRKMSDDPEGLYGKFSPYIATPTVMIKKSLLTGNGFLFCEDLKYGEDSVLWAQLIEKADVLFVPETLASVRIRGANAGRRAAAQMIARVRVYDKCVKLIPGFKSKKSPLFRFAVLLCRFGCLFVNEKNEKKKAVELLAKVLYFVPYCLFKLDRAIVKD